MNSRGSHDSFVKAEACFCFGCKATLEALVTNLQKLSWLSKLKWRTRTHVSDKL